VIGMRDIAGSAKFVTCSTSWNVFHYFPYVKVGHQGRAGQSRAEQGMIL
jgi:hypothetical protein